MDLKWLKVFAGLGVPGLILFVFMKLYDKFNWPIKDLPPVLVFVLALVFLILVFVIALYGLHIYRPRPEIKNTQDGVSMSIPKGCTLAIAATAIASDKLISFEGFRDNELSSPLEVRSISATSDANLIGKLREIATRQIRPYNVSIDGTGRFVARIIESSK